MYFKQIASINIRIVINDKLITMKYRGAMCQFTDKRDRNKIPTSSIKDVC